MWSILPTLAISHPLCTYACNPQTLKHFIHPVGRLGWKAASCSCSLRAVKSQSGRRWKSLSRRFTKRVINITDRWEASKGDFHSRRCEIRLLLQTTNTASPVSSAFTQICQRGCIQILPDVSGGSPKRQGSAELVEPWPSYRANLQESQRLVFLALITGINLSMESADAVVVVLLSPPSSPIPGKVLLSVHVLFQQLHAPLRSAAARFYTWEFPCTATVCYCWPRGTKQDSR